MSSVHPSVIVGVMMLAAAYLAAARRAPQRIHPRQLVAFGLSLATILFALNGPIDTLEDARLFSAHMLQHLMLALVMPPLLLLGLPGWMVQPWVMAHAVRPIFRFVTTPLVAFLVYNAVLIGVHTPSLLDRMCRDENFHIAAHLLLMGSAVVMWWPLLSPVRELPRLSYPAQMLYLFLLLIPMAAVAAPITLASSVIYPWYLKGPHPWGVEPLADQVLGGLLMWVGAGFYVIGVFSLIFYRWAQYEDRDEPPVEAAMPVLELLASRRGPEP